MIQLTVYENVIFFFFNDTATTEIYTLSLHDALPIYRGALARAEALDAGDDAPDGVPHLELSDVTTLELEALGEIAARTDRKSTRLNSSHANISYAVFCLKKNKRIEYLPTVELT